jgi:hypothetical protein
VRARTILRAQRAVAVFRRPLKLIVRVPVQRPRSIRTLALVLTLIGISALGGVLFIPWGQPFPVAPELLHADPLVASWLIFSAATIYCLAALTCAYALWRMTSWAPAAYGCFVASIVLYIALFLYIVRVPSPIGIGLTFFGLLGAGLYWGWHVVRTAYASQAL